MNKTILAITMTALLLVTSLAYAHGGWGIGAQHEDMESIMEEGTYQDLVEYRQETGYGMMPWIDTEEEFQEMQEHHEEMEQYHEENGYGHMGGCHGGYGHRWN